MFPIATIQIDELFTLIGKQQVQLGALEAEIAKRDQIISDQQKLLEAKTTKVKK